MVLSEPRQRRPQELSRASGRLRNWLNAVENNRRDYVRQSDMVANLLEVFDQETFQRQLQDILVALEANLGVRLAPAIGEGMRVRIREGPLQGIEGWVEQRYGTSTVLLRLDFISQAAAIKVEAHQLQLI